MKRLYQWFCLLLIIASFSAMAEVTSLSATVDKNPMLLDESVTLQVTAVGGADSEAIDFSALTGSFRVSKPSVSQSTQIINFDRTSTTTWTLQLFPRRTGTLTIPSFKIDNQSSAPISLRVLPLSEANQAQPRDFYVTAELDSTEVYLQQQVQYQVKIYLAADIQRGSLSEPVLDNAVIQQLGDDKEYQELVNGVRYRVIERNFAVLPQASGNYIIDGPVFQAEVLSGSRQNFAFFNRSKTINRVAPSVEITVLPIPENYQYTWLPSELVQLDEEWQSDDTEFVQGEPITRTITLTALGLIDEQLPNIDVQYHPSFKTYPEQAERATVQQNDRLIAQLVQNTAIIPNQSGTFVLPEISVPWFDVNSGKTRFAVLPAKTVKVVAPASAQSSNNENLSQDTAQSKSDTNELEPLSETAQEKSLFPHIFFGLDALHVVLLVTIFVLLLILLTKMKKQTALPKVSNQQAENVSTSESAAWQTLEQAIQSGDAKSIQTSLRAWLESITGQSIQSVNNTLNNLDADDVAAAFNAALANQYGGQSHDYKPELFSSALSNLRMRLKNRLESQSRTNMYPIN